jgi:glycosyltransferase involved in cell wall biosynthesis
MKILFNITSYNSYKSTGIERYAHQIALGVSKIDSSALIVGSALAEGIPNLNLSNILSISNLMLGKYEYLVRAIWDQTVLNCVIAKHKPDILFFPIQDGMLFPPAKQIVTIHDVDSLIPECRQEINPLRKKLYDCKMPLILKKSSAVVAVSEFTRQGIISAFDIDPEKVHVIYNGYDEERFKVIEEPQSVLNKYDLKADNYFMFMGSILRHKNIINIIKAFAGLKSQATLIIAGACKDKPYLAEIKKLATQLNIPESMFRYLEYVSDSDAPYLCNGAKAYLLPSFHEGFGVPIIEAMACGTPVITSNCSAMPEVAGDAAILVDPHSVESIATAMREIIENPRRAEELKKAGLARVKLFSWAGSARKLYELCQKVSAE